MFAIYISTTTWTLCSIHLQPGVLQSVETRNVDTEGGVAKPFLVNFKNIAITVEQQLMLSISEDEEWKEVARNLYSQWQVS